ncbi:MAG: hypothetical protein IPK68_19655 [Bdellovibrionales bacterium]|nr:hypothetical protein [Bdellovibrionales bacterium]
MGTGNENWNAVTHLNPKANRLHSEFESMQMLLEGKSIHRQKYDHSTGKFTDKIVVNPKMLIVSEGLHPFYIKSVRELYDLRVFIKPDAALASHWKIQRDVSTRGYSKKSVMEQIQIREHDYVRYVALQEKHADVVVGIPFGQGGNASHRRS